MTGTEHLRPRAGIFRQAAALFALSFALALAIGGGSAAVAPAPAAAQTTTCPAQPTGLAPEGTGPARYTMLIRINQQNNVNAYTNFDPATGGLGGYIRPQDVFVINTRFETTTPSVAATLATNLRAAFPCNRIISLTGLGLNPALPGYAFSLAGHPAVFALMTDFELMDWNGTAGTDPGRPPWNQAFNVAFPRIKAWDARLASTLAANPLSAAQRTGLVPIFDSTWNYGQIAQDLDKKNRRLGAPHIGLQSVQTQDSCADGGATAFASNLKGVFDQYKFKTVMRTKTVKNKKTGKKKKKKFPKRVKLKPTARPLLSNLATQISFSNTPNPSAGMAITKTSAATAAACTLSGIKQGGGAFFYFASDDSMRLLFAQPQIAALRPNSVGVSASGGVKPPKK